MESIATLVYAAQGLSDRDVLARLHSAIADERQATVNVLVLLMEIDMRRLYLGEGCSSLFTYCTQVLHLSEDAAYARIQVARTARNFPLVLERLYEGEITLTAVGLLGSHLTPDNHVDLLNGARHKSKREVEQLVATIRPQPDAPAFLRKLSDQPQQPAPADDLRQEGKREALAASPPMLALSRPAHVAPLSPDRYRIQVTVSSTTYEQLRRVRDLMRHTNPSGDLSVVFERAIAVLLADLMKSKLAATERPRPARASVSDDNLRHVPARVKREVWKRDEGRCAFVGAQGRCTETGFLEFHHLVPFAEGGTTTTDNLELRCRAHNGYEAERWFGARDVPVVRETRALWSPSCVGSSIDPADAVSHIDATCVGSRVDSS